MKRKLFMLGLVCSLVLSSIAILSAGDCNGNKYEYHALFIARHDAVIVNAIVGNTAITSSVRDGALLRLNWELCEDEVEAMNLSDTTNLVLEILRGNQIIYTIYDAFDGTNTSSGYITHQMTGDASFSFNIRQLSSTLLNPTQGRVRIHQLTTAQTDFVILDVRLLHEFLEVRIQGSVLIPYQQLAGRALAELPDRNMPILIY